MGTGRSAGEVSSRCCLLSLSYPIEKRTGCLGFESGFGAIIPQICLFQPIQALCGGHQVEYFPAGIFVQPEPGLSPRDIISAIGLIIPFELLETVREEQLEAVLLVVVENVYETSSLEFHHHFQLVTGFEGHVLCDRQDVLLCILPRTWLQKPSEISLPDRRRAQGCLRLRQYP